MYKIIRNYFQGGHRTIRSGLTLEEAQAHCHNPETSSRTATSAKARRLTAARGSMAMRNADVSRPPRAITGPVPAPSRRCGTGEHNPN
jgi:hypothetical protein